MTIPIVAAVCILIWIGIAVVMAHCAHKATECANIALHAAEHWRARALRAEDELNKARDQ
jgi:hypothetical protein